MQIANFPDGGFVVHKLIVSHLSKMSVWYSASGEILCTERWDARGRVCGARSKAIMRDITALGLRLASVRPELRAAIN